MSHSKLKKQHFHSLIINLSLSSSTSVEYLVSLRPAGSAANRAINRRNPAKTSLSMQTSHLAKHLWGKHDSNQSNTGFFISAHQSPINSCFLGLRHAAGCISISTASIIRQQTDDRTLEALWTITHSRQGSWLSI